MNVLKNDTTRHIRLAWSEESRRDVLEQAMGKRPNEIAAKHVIPDLASLGDPHIVDLTYISPTEEYKVLTVVSLLDNKCFQRIWR